MRFKEVSEALSELKKLKTIQGTTFYKKPYTGKKINILKFNEDIVTITLKNVTHLSLSKEGLLAQQKVNPYTIAVPLTEIKGIELDK